MPEGLTLKRIIDMDETQQLSSSDYVLVDSASGGNKKFALGEELSSLKEDIPNGYVDASIKSFDNQRTRRTSTGSLAYDGKSCTTSALISFKANYVLTIKTGYTICFVNSDGTYWGTWTTGSYAFAADYNVYVEVRNASQTALSADEIADMPNVLVVKKAIDIPFLDKVIDTMGVSFVGDFDIRKSRIGVANPTADNKSCVTKQLYTVSAGDILQIKTGYVALPVYSGGSYYGSFTSETIIFDSNASFYFEVRNSSQTSLTQSQINEINDVLVMKKTETPLVKTKQCFVSPSGSNGNSGTKASPFATIAYAISVGYKDICLLDGNYTEVLNFSGLNNINIYADNYMLFSQFPNTPRTRPTFTNGTKYTSFTDDGSYKHFALASAPTRYTDVFINQSRTPTETVNGRVVNSAGLWANFSNRYEDKQLKPVLSLSALSEADTFYYDGTNVYFNTDTDIAGVTVVGNNARIAVFGQCNNVSINGINFEYGFNENLYMPWCNNVRIENCEFGHTVQSHNAEFTMSDVTLVNCLSYLAGLDGYNSSYYGVTRLVNCKGLYNLDDGESSHEFCEIIVEGGEYAYNGKGGHSPVHGCKFSCNGTYSHHNLYGFYLIANNNFILPSSLLISNSVAINNTSYDLINVLYTTLLMNCKIDTKQITSGTVTDLTA